MALISRRIGWGSIGVVSQLLFVMGWLIAGFVQGERYSVLRDSISDMGALNAPYPWVLLVPMGLVGIGTIAFATLGLRPALSDAGRHGRLGPWLIAFFALGLDNISDVFFRLDCRAADSCVGDQANTSWHAAVHEIVGFTTILVLVVATFVMAHRLRNAPKWADLALPSRIAGILLAVGLVALLVPQTAGVQGLIQRAMTCIAAGWVAALGFRLHQIDRMEYAPQLDISHTT